MRLLLTLVSVFAYSAAAVGQTPKPCAPHPLDGRTIVFAANGAGGGNAFSENLRDAAAEAHSGLVIRTVPWAYNGNVPHDNADQDSQLKAAARTAECIQALRAQCPHSRFVLVGYSAGSRVALAAAEMLPPGSLERVVVLGSSVSCNYELRSALRATCGGIDSFYSADDQVLALAEDYLRTTDGQKGAMAGRVGFRAPCPVKAGDPYANLRQYRWTAQLGGQGDHTFWARPVFLRRSLVPLLLTVSCPTAGTASSKEPPLASSGR